MATGAKQSTSEARLLGLKFGPSQTASLHQKSTSPPTSSDSFMTAHASATPTLGTSAITSRLSSTPSPRTPPSPNATSFIQEIDVFMENIGRLVNALEDQHRQRRFNIARPSGNASKNTSIDLGNSFQVTDPPVSNKGANANGSPGFQSSK